MSDMFNESLDLTGSDPDAIGFPAIPSGSYEASIVRAEWATVDNVDGTKKLPDGNPYLKLAAQVKEDEEPRNDQRVAGAWVWTNLHMPPKDYDPSKAQTMKNFLANFLNAVGEDWEKKNYKMPDADTFLGRDVTVVVRKKHNKVTDRDENVIEGFKVAGSSERESEGAGLLA